MLRSLQGILTNFLLLTLPAVLIFTLFFEIVVRLLCPVSDVPDTIFHPQLGNHYVSNQTGLYVRGGFADIQAAYRINAAGWNSPHDYEQQKPEGVTRIAVIGDSYVEAFQVDYDKSFPYLLEKQLNATDNARRFQVYSFGHSGANLVQYLNVLRYSVIPLQPDTVVITLSHNDFQEALYGYSRKDNWSLVQHNGSFVEVPPSPSRSLFAKRMARYSALARYTIVNIALYRRLLFLKQLLHADTRDPETALRPDTNVFSNLHFLRQILHYLSEEFLSLARQYKFKLLFIIDTDRPSIYNNTDPTKSTSYPLNQAVQDVAKRQTIPLLDLTEAFQQAWQNNGQRFEWDIDRHWNPHGHAVVAKAVLDFLSERGFIRRQ